MTEEQKAQMCPVMTLMTAAMEQQERFDALTAGFTEMWLRSYFRFWIPK
ncbi:hypothetical protein GW943_01450 [Candidatus Parcubacteria bacterium]|nr:hypothetical protein [Candidatus Parcubacteria bacterium]